MNNLVKFPSFLLLLLHTEAQMTLGGPGVEVKEYLYTTPSAKVFDLGYHYLYEIHGYYGRTDADQVDGTYVDKRGFMRIGDEQTFLASYSSSGDGNPENSAYVYQLDSEELTGEFRDGEVSVNVNTPNITINARAQGQNASVSGSFSQGSLAKGWVQAAVGLNNKRYPRKMTFQANRVHRNTGDKIFTGPVLRLVDQDMSLGFYMNGNTNDPDGYMVVFGVAIKAPPKPTGQLNVEQFVNAGNFTDVGFNINKPEKIDTDEQDWDPDFWTESLSEPADDNTLDLE